MEEKIIKANRIKVLILTAIMLVLCVQSATSRGTKTSETIKIEAKHETEYKKKVFRTIYEDMVAPIAISPFVFFGNYVEVKVCNVSDEPIKEMIFSYAVFDKNNKKICSVSEKLTDKIDQYAAYEIMIKNPKTVSGWTETIQDINIRIVFDSGREAKLSNDEVIACTLDKFTFSIYKDENISISWRYNMPAAYALMFESTKFFDYSHFRFNVEEYKYDGMILDSLSYFRFNNDRMILDSVDGQFVFDNDWWNEGELEYGEIIMPNYLEYVFKTTKSIEIEYLVGNPNKPKQRNLSEEEMRSIAKKIVIDDETFLERMRAFAAFMNIMGLL